MLVRLGAPFRGQVDQADLASAHQRVTPRSGAGVLDHSRGRMTRTLCGKIGGMNETWLKDVRREIEDGNSAFSAAIAAQDLVRIADAYSDDAVLLLDGAPEQRGREAIETFFRVAFNAGLRSLEFSTLDVQTFGDIAIERGVYAMTSVGDAAAENGRYVVVHQRSDDGAWRALYDVTQRLSTK